MKISPARAAAFDILLRVEQQDAYAVELLHSSLLESLSSADRGLCTELVMGIERWRSRLDDAFAPRLRALDKLDLEVLTALRLAAYQLTFLERVPAHAAINDSVELVKRARKRSAAGLVNAVLRQLSTKPTGRMGVVEENRLGLPPRGFDLARDFAHPLWLVERWIANYGAETAQRICEFDQQVPAAAVRLRQNEDAAAVERELATAGVKVEPGALLRSARRVAAGNITKTRACAEGRIAIQDEASQLVAALVGRGRRILDCCAAPGGKTAATADRNPEAEVLAVELHEHRARLLRKLVTNQNVAVVTADIRNYSPPGQFDCVLVDAPCSGTGTLARNPEIKWRLQPGDLADLQQRQTEILSAAATHAAPGAKLIYATCSLEPEEGEQVVARVLEHRSDLKLLDIREELERLGAEVIWKDVDSMLRGNFLRTIPGIHPCDGFFAAVIEKALR